MHSMRPSLLGVALLGLFFAHPAARADDVRFEITPFGGYRMGGEFDFETEETTGTVTRSVDLEAGSTWGVELGLYTDPTAFYEFLYSTQSTEFDSSDPALDGVDVTTEYYQLGGTAFFPDEQWFVPFLSMTLGATRFSADGFGSETKFSGSLGGGLRLPFSENFAANLGLRGYLTFVDSDNGFFCSSVDGDATCLVRSSGSTYFQAEATLGLTLRF
jgi:hypothetical protein